MCTSLASPAAATTTSTTYSITTTTQQQESFLSNLVPTEQQLPQPNPTRLESVSSDNSSTDVAIKGTGGTPMSPPMDIETPPLKMDVPTETESCHVNGGEHDEVLVSENVKEFLMSVLQLSGLPRFTNHAEERANMSNDEKAAALSDMFGKYCNVDLQKNKRARRDLDPESIAFLIQRMRDEMECIPKSKKEALLEAQQKCGEEEFSDERLERFLRCEGMDAQVSYMLFGILEHCVETLFSQPSARPAICKPNHSSQPNGLSDTGISDAKFSAPKSTL